MFQIAPYILLEDDDIVAINKPPGLLTVPDREGKEVSLKQILKEKYGNIFTVHRLDRETSGIVVFAKNETAHRELSLLFENRATTKIYLGLVIGTPIETSGVVDEPIAEHQTRKGMMKVVKKGKDSITMFDLLESFRLYSWMQFNILTGRTHQIRVHMKHLGHPVVCDPLYGDGKPVLISTVKKKAYHLSKTAEVEKPILSRLALHSSQLKFKLHHRNYQLEAEMPKDLRATLHQLQKNK